MGAGECFGLIGVNGAGKSTTFKMILGSVNIDYLSEHKMKTTFSFQED